MDAQHKELEMMRGEIETEIKTIFKANMKIFDWNIPENDDRKSAELIIGVMQEVIDKFLIKENTN